VPSSRSSAMMASSPSSHSSGGTDSFIR
jgi:hypothetical protein